MRNLLLTISRFAVTAWVGAAVLYVLTSIAEQTSPEFDLLIKDRLAVLRFPFYYAVGFTAVVTALLSGLACRGLPGLSRLRLGTYLLLLVIVLLAMVADYVWVYRPLVEMITPIGRAHSSEFDAYHEASKWVNFADLAIAFVAAVIICWPRGASSD